MQRRQDYISITTGSSALDNLLEGPFVEQLGAGRAGARGARCLE
jgi:hypothetical protein